VLRGGAEPGTCKVGAVHIAPRRPGEFKAWHIETLAGRPLDMGRFDSGNSLQYDSFDSSFTEEK